MFTPSIPSRPLLLPLLLLIFPISHKIFKWAFPLFYKTMFITKGEIFNWHLGIQSSPISTAAIIGIIW
jgi:hypothetical protein